MVDVQARLARHFDRCYAQHPEACIAMVSHADVIRAAVFWVIGLSLDHWQRIEIAPASVTRIAADDHGFRLLQLNEEPA